MTINFDQASILRSAGRVKEQKTISSTDNAGNNVTCVFEDRDDDGKLDLYSITKINPTYDGCTHEITYFDLDGNGTFDRSEEKISSKMVDNNGDPITKDKTVVEEYDTNDTRNIMLKLLDQKTAVGVLKSAMQHIDNNFIEYMMDKILSLNPNFFSGD